MFALFDTNPLMLVAIVLVGVMVADVVRYWSMRERVVYRYVPRSFAEEQRDPIPLKYLVGDMFDRQSPWKASFNIYEKPKLITIGDRTLVVPTN